jgi:hypothetical protein
MVQIHQTSLMNNLLVILREIQMSNLLLMAAASSSPGGL